MWIIKHIFDGDYGCEESSNSEPMVTVTLEDENGSIKIIRIADSELVRKNLDIGCVWEINN